jgi:hypothetical protein
LLFGGLILLQLLISFDFLHLFQENEESRQENSRENVATEENNEDDVKELIIIDPEATV